MPFTIRPFHFIPMVFASLLICLVMTSGHAYAEWKEAYSESDSGFTVWFDPDTIRRKGDLTKMWVLYDYQTGKKAVSIWYFSEKSQMQYDCAEERYRFLARTAFSGRMGSGDVVFDNSDEGKWKPVAPRSVGQVEWKLACEQ